MKIKNNNKIEYVLRIGFDHFDTPSKLRDMIGFCRKAGIGEVQLVPVNYIRDLSVFPPRETIAPRCRKLTEIIRDLTAGGVKTGYCVVRTFMTTSLTGKDYIGFKQGRVDMAGKASLINPCPLDSVYLDYIKYFYASLARTNPATMLVDDDFRYEYLGGVGPSCFCPLHLREFRRRFGHKVTINSLRKVLEAEEPSRTKNDWMEFKRVLLVELAADLRDTVHAVNPDIRVGLMLTCAEISALEGRDMRELIETFAGNLQPVVRPGQGCYADTDRLMILNGLTETIYQSNLMPAGTEIQAEVDFYPHSLFNKSADFGFDFQIKANLACNLKKINIWPFGTNHKITKKHPFADIMAGNNRVFDRILNVIPDDAGMTGVQVVYSPKAAQLRRQRAQDMKMYIEPAPELLWRMGIPWTFADSPVALLNKDSFPMSRDMAETIFKNKNVFMDSDALNRLIKMKVAGVKGIKINGFANPLDHVQEFILNDKRNDAAAGITRGIRAVGKVAELKITARSPWCPLTRFIGLDGKQGAPGMLAAEKAGRRILISAVPLAQNGFWVDEARQMQLHGIFAWLYGGILPAVVRNAPDICPVLMEDPSGHTKVLSLINVSTAYPRELKVELAAPLPANKYDVAIISNIGQIKPIPATDLERKQGGLRITLRAGMAPHPFQVRFIVIRTGAKIKNNR